MVDLSEPGAVRAEDSFDVGALADWLAENCTAVGGLPTVRQFAGGASNLTYQLAYPDRTLILRRPPSGNRARSAHDMGREYSLQHRVRPFFPYIPAMVARCEDPSVIGSDFYVMEKLDGLILRKDPPAGTQLDPALAQRVCRSVLDRLVELHAVDIGAAGLADLGRGEGYVARQVSGWSERFRRARTRNVPSFEPTMVWLETNQPADAGSCLIHNDFRFDNVVLDTSDPARVVGVLDWEMATVGDPLMDVGGALAYWAEAADDPVGRWLRRQPTHLPGMLTRREVWEHYAAVSGRQVDDATFYQLFGLFRLAAIAQQIYARYHAGHTSNPAFRQFAVMVAYLAWRCRLVIREVAA